MTPHPLKAWREINGISQAAVALSLGVDQATVGRYENRRRVPGPADLARQFRISGGLVQPNDYHFPGFAAAQQALVELAREIADLAPAQGTPLFERLGVAVSAYDEQLALLLAPDGAALRPAQDNAP